MRKHIKLWIMTIFIIILGFTAIPVNRHHFSGEFTGENEDNPVSYRITVKNYLFLKDRVKGEISQEGLNYNISGIAMDHDTYRINRSSQPRTEDYHYYLNGFLSIDYDKNLVTDFEISTIRTSLKTGYTDSATTGYSFE